MPYFVTSSKQEASIIDTGEYPRCIVKEAKSDVVDMAFLKKTAYDEAQNFITLKQGHKYLWKRRQAPYLQMNPNKIGEDFTTTVNKIFKTKFKFCLFNLEGRDEVKYDPNKPGEVVLDRNVPAYICSTFLKLPEQ